MAATVKITPGFDAKYPWRAIGTSGTAPHSPLEYYLAPADKGGEPPGRWAGRGLAALEFTAGHVIDREVFEPLYGQHVDPRDPSGRTRLGRAPQQFASEQDIYAELVAAEPHASPARKQELRALAKARTRRAVPFWDITISVSKSITLFYGGLLAAAEQARQAGDEAAARAQEQLRRDIAQAQARASLPPQQAQAHGTAYPLPAPGLTPEQERQVMAEAIATVQGKMPTWTKADLIRHLGEALPAGAFADRATLVALADRAVSGETGENVALLSAPEWPRVPARLRRADGASVFRPHGAERYASQAQLTLEERLLAQAQEPTAPRLDPDTAAQLLGADRARLEEQLRPDIPATAAALSETTDSGLRMDQAAAAYHVLTSPRRAEVVIGPAGTGKTRAATEMARIWAIPGTGPAVALTTSSNARNVIREEAARHDVALAAYNTAEWLGHTEQALESKEPIALAPGTLIILDEASMMPLADLAAVMRRATEHGAKVAVTGDPLQLQAVDGGGGMTMLARKLGHVQLSEAGRFTSPWEREASLRLRDGDDSVLAGYRQHDRLHAGYAEDILEDAARAYLYDRLNGRDTLLMTSTEAMATELSRRVCGDLVRWGHVSDGSSVRLRDGTRASAGDLIMTRKNSKFIDAGEKGRSLANRDVLRITNIAAKGDGQWAQAERLTGRDAAGQEQWSAPFDLHRSYLENSAHLAYAVTFHTAEGRTVDSGIAVFTGDEDRQAVNVGMTRGRERNEAFVIAGWRIADPRPGPEDAPELARQEQLDRERAGFDPARERRQPQQTAEEVLAACLARDGQQMSATDTREAEYSDADRLDVLGVQWEHVVREAGLRRYQAALQAALPEQQTRQVMDDPAATWLWRSLREAETAGLDGPAVLRRAIAAGDLADAESVAKVIDWRIRQQTAGMPALAARPWAEQIEPNGDPEMDRYWHELADAMADRQRRLGEHAAEHPPAWAQALGPVPEHPVDRAEWAHRAGLVEKYRERWGYTHPYEPIGARPGQHSPDAAADWQAAAEALGRQPGDLREHSDGQLWAWRSAFAREMEWAPPYPGDKLADARAEIRRADIEADRAQRNAQAATDAEAGQRLADKAAIRAQWAHDVREYVAQLTGAQAGYDAWERVAAPSRERAVAADAELRRRHPERHIEPLCARDAKQEQPEPAATKPEPATTAPQAPAGPDLAPHADKMDQAATQIREMSAWLDEAVMRRAREASEKAAEIESTQYQPDDPDGAPVAAWKTELETRQREAVRHEPLPRVPAAKEVHAEAEAGVSGPEAAE